MSAQPKFAADSRRRAMIGKVKIAQKELGLDDTTYRAVLQRVTGRASAADCTEAQLGAVLDEFKAKGWTPKSPVRHDTDNGYGARSQAVMSANPPKPRPADHPSAKKARALWISLWQLGEVRDRSETALEAFARRQLHCERLQWADQRQVFRLIEALKAMAERAGWSQDLAGVERGLHVAELKRRLANAIRRQLGEFELKPTWLHFADQLDDMIGQAAARLRERKES